MNAIKHLVISAFFTAVLFRALWGHSLNETLWADGFDPNMLLWSISWVHHALFELKDLGQFWHGNILHPHPWSLGISDSLTGLLLFFSPLRFFEISPIASLTLSLMGNTLLSSFLLFQLLNKAGLKNLVLRTWVVWLSHFSMGMATFYLHYQLFGFQWIAPTWVALWIWLRDGRTLNWIRFLVLFCMGFSISAYAGPMMVAMGSLTAAAVALTLPGRRMLINRLRRDLASTAWVTVGIMLPFAVAQVWPYLQMQKEFGAQDMAAAYSTSAKPWTLFLGKTRFSTWYGSGVSYAWGDWEKPYFQGYLALLLGLGGVATSLSNRLKNHRWKIWGLLALFISGWVLSWGPFWFEGARGKLPFYYLSKFLPGLSGVRSPGRFGALLGFPLALLSLPLFYQLSSRMKSRFARSAMALLLLVPASIEGLTQLPVEPFALKDPNSALFIRQFLPQDGLVLELPVAQGDHLKNIAEIMEQMKRSTLHWGRLVVGYGGRTSDQVSELLELDWDLQQGIRSSKNFVPYIERMKFQAVHLRELRRYPSSFTLEWVSYCLSQQALGRGRLIELSDGLLFLRY